MLQETTKPSLYIEEADFCRFIVIEKLRFVFCFIPEVSCATLKRVLHAVENMGKATDNPHRRILFRWLSDYTPSKRKEILDSYYKAMFVRHPFERLASAVTLFGYSLSALADVLGALSEQRSHIPYRNTRLTHMLQDTIGRFV